MLLLRVLTFKKLHSHHVVSSNSTQTIKSFHFSKYFNSNVPSISNTANTINTDTSDNEPIGKFVPSSADEELVDDITSFAVQDQDGKFWGTVKSIKDLYGSDTKEIDDLNKDLQTSLTGDTEFEFSSEVIQFSSISNNTFNFILPLVENC